jgi:hypothetical protein
VSRFLMCCTLTSLLAAVGCDKHREHAGKPLPLPIGVPHLPVGMVAIPVAPGASPPFNAANVQSYIGAHNLPLNLGPKTVLHVAKLEFLQNSEVTQRLGGASTGLPDSALIGFATISGGLTFTGPMEAARLPTFSLGYAAIDATNGNLLMVGSLADSAR